MTEGGAGPCSLCGGTGFIIIGETGASRARRCPCRKPAPPPEGTEAFLETSRVPHRYAECDFQSYAAYGPHEFSLANARSLAMRYADEYPLSDRGLLFMGASGVGKTHLAVATMRRLTLEKGVP